MINTFAFICSAQANICPSTHILYFITGNRREHEHSHTNAMVSKFSCVSVYISYSPPLEETVRHCPSQQQLHLTSPPCALIMRTPIKAHIKQRTTSSKYTIQQSQFSRYYNRSRCSRIVVGAHIVISYSGARVELAVCI